MNLKVLVEQLITKFPKLQVIEEFGELTFIVPAVELIALCEYLKKDKSFAQLIDICGIDYKDYGIAQWDSNNATATGFSRGVTSRVNKANVHPERFAIAYHLLSLEHNLRLRLRCYVADTDMPCLDSVVDIWPSANWYEREAYDLFGILFKGHPDLRRILTDYGFIGHPLRKDFPLSGEVEVRYDERLSRVIYEPVNIAPRTLVPKTIPADNRYVTEGQE